VALCADLFFFVLFVFSGVIMCDMCICVLCDAYFVRDLCVVLTDM
jgi:hypothetical protein